MQKKFLSNYVLYAKNDQDVAGMLTKRDCSARPEKVQKVRPKC